MYFSYIETHHYSNVRGRFVSKKRKSETFIYEGLGFPIRLVNVPLKKVLGDEWAIDIDFNILQKTVLHMLALKSTPLTGQELRFIIDYFELSYREFAKLIGVTHAAVVKWEKEKSRMNPSTEICLRLHILNYLKVSDKEFRQFYLKMNHEDLSRSESETELLEIGVDQIAC